MVPASRTPEGEPLRCHLCGQRSNIDPSRPPGDAICPSCGTLVWLNAAIQPIPATHPGPREKSLRERLFPDHLPDPYDAEGAGAGNENRGDYLREHQRSRAWRFITGDRDY